MSPELRRLLGEHAARLRRLLAEHQADFARLEMSEPTLLEREGAATALHSFYTGVEFIMRSVAERFDGGVDKAGDWHSTLLDSMRRAAPGRPPLLSDATADRLRAYLVFRHRFRNIYGFELDWALMKPLVLGLEETLAAFEADLARFLAALPSDG